MAAVALGTAEREMAALGDAAPKWPLTSYALESLASVGGHGDGGKKTHVNRQGERSR